MKTELNVHSNDIIAKKTVKALLCGLLEHERVNCYKDDEGDYVIDSGRYRISMRSNGLAIKNRYAVPGLVALYMRYINIHRIGLSFINDFGTLGIYIELDNGSCMIIPDESGVEIKRKVLDMVNYARAADNIEKELYSTEEE